MYNMNKFNMNKFNMNKFNMNKFNMFKFNMHNMFKFNNGYKSDKRTLNYHILMTMNDNLNAYKYRSYPKEGWLFPCLICFAITSVSNRNNLYICNKCKHNSKEIDWNKFYLTNYGIIKSK